MFWLRFPRAQMKRFFVSCLFALLGATSVHAGTESPPPVEPVREPSKNNFSAGAWEFQNVSGAYFFFDTTQNNRPAIDYSLDSIRLGIMLNDPWSLGLLSGNFELLGEIFAG